MNTVQAYPDAAQQEPETARVSPSTPKGWAKVPHSLARDSTLTPIARLLWVILDGRQGQYRRIQVSRKTLATDLGVSLSTTKRALAELVSAGLVSPKRSGRATLYTVHNTARDGSQVDSQDAQKGQERTVRRVTSEPSTKQELLRKKKASKQVRESVTEGPELVAAAAASVAQELARALPSLDPIAWETYRDALPRNLRPAQSRKVCDLVALGLSNSWTATGLAQAVAKEVPNPNAGPGVAVNVLEQLAQQPAREHLQPAPSREWTDFLPSPQQPRTASPEEQLENVPSVQESLQQIRRALHTKASA